LVEYVKTQHGFLVDLKVDFFRRKAAVAKKSLVDSFGSHHRKRGRETGCRSSFYFSFIKTLLFKKKKKHKQFPKVKLNLN
jgi:hypothetical protein